MNPVKIVARKIKYIIIDGYKEGALVELDVMLDNSNIKVTIQSYLSRAWRRNFSTQIITGIWKIYSCNGDLRATLEQNRPPRIIYYRLYKK